MADKYVTIKFEPMGRLMDGRLNETIMTVAAKENLPIRSDCGGNGKCGKCLVVIDPVANVSSPTQAEVETVSPEKLADNIRLACQAQILGPLTVSIPQRFMDVTGAQGKSLAEATYPLNPMVRRIYLQKAPLPSGKTPIADIAHWFAGRLNDACGSDLAMPDHHVLRRISPPDILRKDSTVVVHKAYGATSIIEGKAPGAWALPSTSAPLP